jgi:hypothetical protein
MGGLKKTERSWVRGEVEKAKDGSGQEEKKSGRA